MLLMLSAPPASTTSAAPVWIIIAAVAMACRPPPQRRSICMPGTLTGRPACSAVHRPTQGVSLFTYDCAKTTSSIDFRADPGPFQHLVDPGGGQVSTGTVRRLPPKVPTGVSGCDDRGPANSGGACGHVWCSSVQSPALLRERPGGPGGRSRSSARAGGPGSARAGRPLHTRSRSRRVSPGPGRPGPCSRATMRLAGPAVGRPVVEGRAITGIPPGDRAAPRRKSAALPVPPT